MNRESDSPPPTDENERDPAVDVDPVPDVPSPPPEPSAAPEAVDGPDLAEEAPQEALPPKNEAPENEAPEPGTADGEPPATASDGDTTDAKAEAKPRPAKKKPAPFSPVPPERLEGAVEALLLVSGDVLTLDRLRDLLGLTSVIHVREALESIQSRWEGAGLAVEIQALAGGYRVTTRPEFAEYVQRLSRRPVADRLSPSLLETLSIVAYRQPVPRVEVERIRGVQAGEALRNLLERRLLKVTGRSEQPGRPLLYGTTRRFLEVFGLGSLKDLPKKGDLKSL